MLTGIIPELLDTYARVVRARHGVFPQNAHGSRFSEPVHARASSGFKEPSGARLIGFRQQYARASWSSADRKGFPYQVRARHGVLSGNARGRVWTTSFRAVRARASWGV